MEQAQHNGGDARFTILMRPVQQNNPVIKEIRHVRCQVVLQTDILLLPLLNLIGVFLHVLKYCVSLSRHSVGVPYTGARFRCGKQSLCPIFVGSSIAPLPGRISLL